MKIKIVLAALLACMLWHGWVASAQVLFTYQFSDVVNGSSSISAGGTANNLTFSSFSASGVSATATASNVFSFSNWSSGASSGFDTFTGGFDVTDYFEFTITPVDGYAFTLSNLTFAAGRTSTGPRQFAVRSNADEYAANLTASAAHANVSIVASNTFQFTDNSGTEIYSGNTITLTSGAFTSITDPVTFRIYAFNAEAANGGFRIDDFSISGTVSAIPEPSTYAALFGALALGFAVWRRHRSRRAP